MGCTASKPGNEDTVRRCKERRRLMKQAVYARHHLAAAHSNYCRSLRETGSALSAFAAGEPLFVSDETPSVVLRTPSTLFGSTTATINPLPPRVPSPSATPTPSLRPPRPPPPFFPSPSPSPTVASSKLPGTLSASSRSSSRRRNPMKLPHILSESSPSSSPQSHNTTGPNNYTYQANWTLPSTPSQASSVWNWENFYPPSPPDSDYFQRRNNEADRTSYHVNRQDHHKHHHTENEEGWKEMEMEEVQCSEYGDHCSTTSSSDVEDGDRDSRSEIGTRSNFGSSMHNDPPAWNHSTMIKSNKSDGASWKAGNGEISDMKIVVRHRDLAEIVAAIKEYFDKAASAGENVSEMLETGRNQFDSSFRHLRKTVYHSSGMLGNLSSRWSSKPPLAVKYQFEPGSMDEPGGSRSLCSTLERLFAWEKKLYEEVKAREGVKIEHEKKLSALHSQERKGGEEAKLDKTMTSIKRLQSLVVVTSQAVSTNSSAINGLRDTELVPQLVELCHGFMYMWRSMNQFHEVQKQIVQQVRGLVNRSANSDSTTDLHRQATHDLESAVSAWHSSFCCLTKFQRDFICSLHGWFKLTIFPVNNELASGNKKLDEVFSFCDEWKLALDRLPDTVASEAIKSFINVVHAISVRQTEEVKMKKRTESASKELGRKASGLRNMERKYYHSYYTVGISLPDMGPDNGHALDARDHPLAEKKSELAACRRRVEDETLKLSKAVDATRAMTLNNIQTGLPGVFQAMTSFSAILVEALEVVCNRSYSIK